MATLWSDRLDIFAIPLEDEGNERITVTLFDISRFPVCVINSYLPSGSNSAAVSNFSSDMDAIHEILMKYHPKYNIVLRGDLNADHYNPNGQKEVRLKVSSVSIAYTTQETATLQVPMKTST